MTDGNIIVNIVANGRFDIAAFVLLNIIMVVGVEVEIRHQLGLDIIHSLGQRLQELVEVFFVQEDLVPVVTILVKFLPAFGDSKIIVVTTCCPLIKEIRPAFAIANPFALVAFHSFVVVFVRHNDFFSVENY